MPAGTDAEGGEALCLDHGHTSTVALLPDGLILDSKQLPPRRSRYFDRVTLVQTKTFCKLCLSMEILMNFALVLAIGVGLLFIVSLYPGKKINFWLLTLLVLALIAFGLAIQYLLQLLLAANCCKTPGGNMAENRSRTLTWSQKLGTLPCLAPFVYCGRRVVHMSKRVENRLPKSSYIDFVCLDSKYYLLRMAIFELFGKLQQVYMVITDYLCTMPVFVTGIINLVLLIDLLVQIWANQYIEASILTRNRKYLVSIVTNMFIFVFPMAYSWFNFYILRNADYTLFFLAGYPAASILAKVHTLWKDMIQLDLQRVERSMGPDRWSIQRTRREVSKDPRNMALLQLQLEHFPSWLRKCFKGVNILLASFFLIMLGIQFTTWANMELLDLKCNQLYSKEIWTACTIPVPFCQYSFTERCDCAVFSLRNFSRVVLPEETNNMHSLIEFGVYASPVMERLPVDFGLKHPKLKVVRVVGSNLTALPTSIGKMHELVVLWVMNSRLTLLPDSVTELKSLLDLRVNGNALVALPSKLGDLTELNALWAHKNRLRKLPESIGKLKKLSKIMVNNNELESLPNSLGQLRKQLLYLYLYNNRIAALPATVVELEALAVLFVWNNSLISLPKNMGKLKTLQWLDVRHNRISQIPSSIQELNNLNSFYGGFNPFCGPTFSFQNTLKGMSNRDICQKQCALDCPANFLANDICEDVDLTFHFISEYELPMPDQMPDSNEGCNTKLCGYSNGHCPQPPLSIDRNG